MDGNSGGVGRSQAAARQVNASLSSRGLGAGGGSGGAPAGDILGGGDNSSQLSAAERMRRQKELAAQKRASRLQGNLASANPIGGNTILPGMPMSARPAMPPPMAAHAQAAPAPGRSAITAMDDGGVPWASPGRPGFSNELNSSMNGRGAFADAGAYGGGATVSGVQQVQQGMAGMNVSGMGRAGEVDIQEIDDLDAAPLPAPVRRAEVPGPAPAAPPLHTQGSSGLYNTRAEVPQAPVQTSDATRARGMPMSPPEPSPLRPQLPPPGAPHALMTARSMDRRDSEEEGEGAAAVQMAPHEPGKPETPQVQVPVRQYMANMESFLGKPAPKGALVKCYIIRDREKSKTHPTYRLYLYEDDGFMLAAVKRKHNRTSNYMISLDENDLIRESDAYFGKLRSNFVGTEFVMYDNGVNPKKVGKKGSLDGVRRELGVVLYQANLLGTKGPRQMTAILPAVDDDTARPVDFRPMTDKDGLLQHYRQHTRSKEWMKLENKKPKWNAQVGAYVLNFNGRVTLPSIKNFQLITEADEDYIILQFGKVGKDAFTMDFQYPISALQAFAICLSSFDKKLACE